MIKTYLHWNWYKMNIEEDEGIGASCETVGSAATAQKTNVCEKKLVKESEKHCSPLWRQVGMCHVCASLLIHEYPVFAKTLELFCSSQFSCIHTFLFFL